MEPNNSCSVAHNLSWEKERITLNWIIKSLLEACESILDQQQNIIFTIHVKLNFNAYTYTLRWCKPFQQEETPYKSEDG